MPLFKHVEDGGDTAVVNSVFLGLLTIVFAVSLGLTTYLAYVCTLCVPTDVIVSKQREMKLY